MREFRFDLSLSLSLDFVRFERKKERKGEKRKNLNETGNIFEHSSLPYLRFFAMHHGIEGMTKSPYRKTISNDCPDSDGAFSRRKEEVKKKPARISLHLSHRRNGDTEKKKKKIQY